MHKVLHLFLIDKDELGCCAITILVSIFQFSENSVSDSTKMSSGCFSEVKATNGSRLVPNMIILYLILLIVTHKWPMFLRTSWEVVSKISKNYNLCEILRSQEESPRHLSSVSGELSPFRLTAHPFFQSNLSLFCHWGLIAESKTNLEPKV